MKKILIILSLTGFVWADYSWLINYKINKLGITNFNERMYFASQEMSKIANDHNYLNLLLFEYNSDLCDNSDDLNACNKAGVYQYNNGNYKNAASWFEYTCNKNNAVGCGNLGDTYSELKNYVKTNQAYEKGCKLNDSRSCNNLGWSYQNKLGKKLNYTKAREFYIKACNLGNGVGCDNVAWMYIKALGVPKNIKIAKNYFKKACNLGYQKGCKNYNSY